MIASIYFHLLLTTITVLFGPSIEPFGAEVSPRCFSRTREHFQVLCMNVTITTIGATVDEIYEVAPSLLYASIKLNNKIIYYSIELSRM